MFNFKRKSEVLPKADPVEHAGKIVIRVIEDADQENCRTLLKRHHNQTSLSDYAFSDQKFDAHARKIFSRPDNMICFIAERINDDGGEIVGLLWASAGSYALSDELILTNCHIVTVDQELLGPTKRIKTFLRLIKAVKTWSDTRGAKQVLVHVTTGSNLKATDRLLRRSGATLIGGGYVV